MTGVARLQPVCSASNYRFTDYAGTGRPDSGGRVACPCCGKMVKLGPANGVIGSRIMIPRHHKPKPPQTEAAAQPRTQAEPNSMSRRNPAPDAAAPLIPSHTQTYAINYGAAQPRTPAAAVTDDEIMNRTEDERGDAPLGTREYDIDLIRWYERRLAAGRSAPPACLSDSLKSEPQAGLTLTGEPQADQLAEQIVPAQQKGDGPASIKPGLRPAWRDGWNSCRAAVLGNIALVRPVWPAFTTTPSQQAAPTPITGPVTDGGTPGEWFVRQGPPGTSMPPFVAAPDCTGYPYDAEILGEDEYREDRDRRLADCELIVKAVNAYRAAGRAAPAPQTNKESNNG